MLMGGAWTSPHVIWTCPLQAFKPRRQHFYLPPAINGNLGPCAPPICSLDDEDDIEDEDDVSWKVRRAAAKLLSAIILNYADALSEVRTPARLRRRWQCFALRSQPATAHRSAERKASFGAGSWLLLTGSANMSSSCVGPSVVHSRENIHCIWGLFSRQRALLLGLTPR